MTNSILSDLVVDSEVKNNRIKVNKKETIYLNNTFRVETKDVLLKLLAMKKGHYLIFKKDEVRVLNNALLKIQREQCYGLLSDYSFSTFKKEWKRGKVMVVRN
jgi:hypothetical protein